MHRRTHLVEERAQNTFDVELEIRGVSFDEAAQESFWRKTFDISLFHRNDRLDVDLSCNRNFANGNAFALTILF
jgi:hypothetical protein